MNEDIPPPPAGAVAIEAAPSPPSGAVPIGPDITPATGGGPARITVRPGGQTEPLPSTETEPSWGDIAKDVGLSTAIGIPKGIIGMAGLPEALANWGAQGLGYLTGQDPETFRDQGAMRLPSTQQIRSKVEDVTGPLYEPKTPYGQYGQTFGEFIPAALTGPGGIVPRLVRQALVPAIASESAGQFAGSVYPPAEPYVRGAAALVTGMKGVGKSDLAAAETAKQQLQTIAEQGVKKTYQAFDQAAANIPIPLGAKITTSNQMRAELNQLNFPTDLAQGYVKTFGKKTDVAGLVKWRQEMRQDLRKQGQYQSVQVLTKNVDNLIDQAMPAGGINSDLLRFADRQNAHNYLMKAITTRLNKVEGGTSAAASGMNFDNKLRQSLEQLKTEPIWHDLSATERLKVDHIIEGGIPKNFLRKVSNIAGGGGGMGKMIAMWVAHELGGYPGVAAVEGMSKLKLWENAIARREERDLVAGIMGRSFYAPQVGRLAPIPFEQRVGRATVYGGLPGTLAPD